MYVYRATSGGGVSSAHIRLVNMASTVSLESLLDTIPVEKRHLLDHKLEDSIHLATIARTISDWPTVLLYLPNLKENDVEAIQHDHKLSYQQQR